MGSERHRYFLHAVSLVGGASLERVDMALYQCVILWAHTSTLKFHTHLPLRLHNPLQAPHCQCFQASQGPEPDGSV